MTAIVPTEILLKYTTLSGSAGNSTTSTPNASLGKYVSTTAWPGGTPNDLFDDISGAENAASTVDYRCVGVHNSNTSNSLVNAVAYLSAETAGGASLALAADTTATSAVGSATAQMLAATSETVGPQTSLTYTAPTTAAAGVALGSIPSGSVKGLWIRRTAANTAALSSDGATVAVTGDTGSL
jgi:hypothetical protein